MPLVARQSLRDGRHTFADVINPLRDFILVVCLIFQIIVNQLTHRTALRVSSSHSNTVQSATPLRQRSDCSYDAAYLSDARLLFLAFKRKLKTNPMQATAVSDAG